MMNSTTYLSKLARGKSERRGSLIQIIYDDNVCSVLFDLKIMKFPVNDNGFDFSRI